MVDPTASLKSGPSGLMTLQSADSAASGSASTDGGAGFASALAQAGAASPADPAASDSAACLAPAIARIEPLPDDAAANAAADALQALLPLADAQTASSADAQALELSFGSLAGLAQQLSNARGDSSAATEASRSQRPAQPTAVDSAIAALVEALQFAPRGPAAEAMLAGDAPLLTDGDADVPALDDGDSEQDPAIVTDPSLLALAVAAALPAQPAPTPAVIAPVVDDAAGNPGEQDLTLAPTRGRGDNKPAKTAGTSLADRAAARTGGNDHGNNGSDNGSDRPAIATQRTTDAGATETAASADPAPRVAEPRASPAHRAGSETMFQPFAAGAAAAASSASSASTATATAAPFHAQLSTAIDSPAFGSALGLQISTLADHGISEARLHLNPAELGPIAVQIGLDGSLAQVTMSVEHSSTRQALEQAMPELAAALRDAGFTMTGGGVSQQARESQQQAAAAAQHGGRTGTTDDALAAIASPARTTRRGMLDVYA